MTVSDGPIAHELGHLIMHSTPPDGDPEEQAEVFARELLLPRREIEADLRNLTFPATSLSEAEWRVPMKELITAASRRSALPPSKVKSLAVQYSRAGWSAGEPYPLAPELPTVVDAAIQIHLSEHEYTLDQLAPITDSLPEKFVEEYGLDESPGRLSGV
ncbi:MAG TPA: ImmA/IrrE family metallo-endopeptidase [Acidimicrobiales bacterium]|nr:ImmA/IrrE family metallo-endopeptidase [Acidimicrobiales bacterium]